jgi:hypothetical protein
MDFSQALVQLRAGHEVARKAWRGKQRVQIRGTGRSAYLLLLHAAPSTSRGWTTSDLILDSADVLAIDWVVCRVSAFR